MKRLIVCCDGTWSSEGDLVEDPAQEVPGSLNLPGAEGGRSHRRSYTSKARIPTNVWRLHNLIAASAPDGAVQRRYYQPGVGTDPTRGVIRRVLDRYGGGAFGWGLDGHIKEVYRWLIREFDPGDELWFFGFSRGAYTARSTVGLIRNCGILRRAHEDMVDRALALYRARGRNSAPAAPQSTSFRANYGHETRIRFLGVWDTVGALGIPTNWETLGRIVNFRHRFHDLELSSWVDYACHAVAIDERRRAFRPTLWENVDASRTTVEQVWFAGVHSDIGGGRLERGLSDVALEWMTSRAAAEGLALRTPDGDETLTPRPLTAEIRDSRSIVHYLPRLAPIRTMAAGARDFVHVSARDRFDRRKDYRPPNLAAALAAGRPPILEETRLRISARPGSPECVAEGEAG